MADQNVETCLRMLKKATSDNEKFAGIMMVTKVIKAENCDSTMKQELADAIGLKFLTRLLRSSNVPEGCPPTMYKSLALSILSTICTDPVVASLPEIKGQVSALNELIISPPRSEENEVDTAILKDCYQCLYGLACCQQGQLYLIQSNTVSCLVEVVIDQIEGDNQALEILLILAGSHGNSMWNNQKSACNKLISYLSSQYIHKKDSTKFDVCKNLVSFISTLEKETVDSNNDKQWLKDLITVLSSDIKNKLGVEQRQCLLLLISELVNKFTLSCLLSPFASDCKVVLIITHLVCIEVRMILENSTWQEMKEKTCLLCSCYLLLENIISHMTTGQPMGFEEKQVLQVHASMVGAFNAVLFFLDEISTQRNKKWLDPLVTASIRVIGSWLAEETTALKHTIYKLLPFLIQLLKISLDPKLAESLPDIPQDVESQLQECDISDNQSMKAIENCDSQSESMTQSMETDQSNNSKETNQSDNSKSSVTNEPKCVRFSPDVPKLEKDMTVDILRFLLPGLCHLSSEEEPRHILIDNNIQDILLQYFKTKWQQFLEHDENEEEVKDTLGSLCGVFLNLTVTEQQLVQKDSSFHSLLEILFTALPYTIYKRENLILTANFTTLGLMLLQHQTSYHSDKEEERNKYVSHCINFFSHAYQLNTSNKPKIVVNEDYLPYWQDISELWFLGIQALCPCIKLYSSTPSIILKSGWLVSMVKMLLEVKGEVVEEDIVDVIVQLLLTLSQCDKASKQVILEKGGLQLARIYKNTELEAILSR
ncbi:hypothetical protein LOTGIDRAFT_238919 [Lottia gigantea]|uniref:Neurochondrin n=1 Tax=Lottia gigantea TaxID=225164 RepID=V4APF3_LOTGI|nr:hypothetical protein LOTGIDRAFT_238919 [Lottia gigantea]ESO99077.1 hypothetical protein LOTGIDRAFT_238919 [Lottia gigantea]